MQKEQSKLLKKGCSVCNRRDRFWSIPVVSVYKRNPVGFICSRCGSSFDEKVELKEAGFLHYRVVGVS